jgi:hypothetical protein
VGNHANDNPNVQELADQVIGTCSGACKEAEQQIEELGVEETKEFCDLAFICDICGWWCSTDELHNIGDDQHCDDCEGDQESGLD